MSSAGIIFDNIDIVEDFQSGLACIVSASHFGSVVSGGFGADALDFVVEYAVAPDRDLCPLIVASLKFGTRRYSDLEPEPLEIA